MRQTIFSIVCFIIASCASSCDDTLSGAINTTEVTVSITIPSDAVAVEAGSERISFRNVASGLTYSYVPNESIMLIPGMYDVAYEAAATLANGASSTLRALRQSVIVGGAACRLELEAYCIVDYGDLIISEIFFAGTLQRSGNQYFGDDYVKLYNNSDRVIYADGLTFFETRFLTTEKRVYTPDIMDKAVTVQALYTIPGSGHDHPVAPGQYLLLADTGIDHRVINPNSFDLSHADFEWYDISTKPNNLDIDGPTVENLDKWYCYTQSLFLLHNRGFKAYGIARIPVERETYLRDYLYSFDYEIVSAAGTFPMSGTAYKLPDEWIVDIVNCSVESDYAWNLCAPSLDSGWTHCGSIDKDKNRFFRAVRRKLLRVNNDGTPLFKDTNNSSVDFNADVIPSEIELQHSAIDAEGTPSTAVTYDGIIPVSE